jgi:hypothetical protein
MGSIVGKGVSKAMEKNQEKMAETQRMQVLRIAWISHIGISYRCKLAVHTFSFTDGAHCACTERCTFRSNVK